MSSKLISPPKLESGDTVVILSTARKISNEEILPAIEIFSSWGLKVVTSPNLFEIDHQFAGSDEIRVSDLNEAISNPEVKAIFCARGGYGTSRILDSIELSPLFQIPKWIVGFSDVTALHIHLLSFGFESVHGIMPISFLKPNIDTSIETLRNVLFGGLIEYNIQPNVLNRLGTSNGLLLGGNLSLINHLIGTNSEPDWKDKVLFIEDIDEYLYHLDRLMVQLKRSGVLKSISGLVVGSFSDMKDNTVPFGKNAYEIIKSHILEYNYPVCFGLPIGHENENWAVISGRETLLQVSENGVTLSQKN